MPTPFLQTITPSDTVLLPISIRQLWVGVSGNVKVLAVGDSTPVVLPDVPAGTWVIFNNMPIAQVFATGTTATGIVGSSVPTA
jgi:hypothetical protein